MPGGLTVVPTRVLIAEDEPHLVESLSFILGREGYEVRAAQDGEAALDEIQRSLPDLVILDVLLPKLNGFEILKRIRTNAAWRALPVIILTAKGQHQDRKAAELIGVDAFVTKPFSNKAILDQVKQLLAG